MLQSMFYNAIIMFLGALAYLAGGIVPAMALSEIDSTKMTTKAIANVLVATALFFLLYSQAGYLLSSFLAIIILLLMFTDSVQEKYFMFLPLLLGGAIVSMNIQVLLLVMIVLFLKGMIDYERVAHSENKRAKVTLNSRVKYLKVLKNKMSWNDRYINNILYLLSMTFIVALMFGLVN